MKAFVLGGSGQYGRVAAEFLAADDAIDRIVIAGRGLEHAQATAASLGSKASAVAADATDEDGLAALLAGSDVLVNMSGPYSEIGTAPIRAAIRAGIAYTDIAEHWSFFESALDLDGAARAAGVTAIVGCGANPGTSNLLAMHAAGVLDTVEAIEVRWVADDELTADEVRAVVDDIRATGRLAAGFQYMILGASGASRNYLDGAYVDTAPFETAVAFEVPCGDAVTVIPIGLAEPITLPRAIPGVRTVTNYGGFYPEPLNDLLRRQAGRVIAGEASVRQATVDFFQACADKPERWLARNAEGAQSVAFVAALGTKDGRPARYEVTLNANHDDHEDAESAYTSSVVALATLELLRGNVSTKGAAPIEACFAPLPFFAALSRYWSPWNAADGLLIESLTV